MLDLSFGYLYSQPILSRIDSNEACPLPTSLVWAASRGRPS